MMQLHRVSFVFITDLGLKAINTMARKKLLCRVWASESEIGMGAARKNTIPLSCQPQIRIAEAEELPKVLHFPFSQNAVFPRWP